MTPAPPARTALITGVAGQDGVLLARLLLAEGARVVGVALPADRGPVPDGVDLRRGDVTDRGWLAGLVEEAAPDEVYHLAGLSSVGRSWDHPAETMRVNAQAVVQLLEILRERQGAGASTGLFLASTAEIFGPAARAPQREDTPLNPRSPYAVAKAAAQLMTVTYRESYGLRASCGILYNHESPLRPVGFVTRKITAGVAAIARGRADRITLGSLDVARDWGWAPDYVRGMRDIVRAPEPGDVILATGRLHTLGDFLTAAFARVGIDDWGPFVESAAALRRPTDAPALVGDPARARDLLGWRPTRSFAQVVEAMVDFDLRLLDEPDAVWAG